MCHNIRCDGESWKLFGFQGELNKARGGSGAETDAVEARRPRRRDGGVDIRARGGTRAGGRCPSRGAAATWGGGAGAAAPLFPSGGN